MIRHFRTVFRISSVVSRQTVEYHSALTIYLSTGATPAIGPVLRKKMQSLSLCCFANEQPFLDLVYFGTPKQSIIILFGFVRIYLSFILFQVSSYIIIFTCRNTVIDCLSISLYQFTRAFFELPPNCAESKDCKIF